MNRRVTVALHTAHGKRVETVDVGPLATDAAAVDMARRQAGISGADFETGEVVS